MLRFKVFATIKNIIIISGIPVRQDLLNLQEKTEEAYSFFNLETDKKTLLVLGGSQGSRRINQLIETKLDFFNSIGLQVVWLCGKLYSEDYSKHNSRNLVQVHKFINRMDLAYAAADFVISRAGASSVSELCVVGKPVIFIPSPNVSEDHQTKNALSLVNYNAAILVKDVDAKSILVDEALSLLKDKERWLKCDSTSSFGGGLIKAKGLV